LFAVVLALAACADDGGETRLIQMNDPQYADLETPEAPRECSQTSDCKHSCVHSCIAVPTGPFTCPSTPPPEPDRLVGASCRCVDQICAWY